MRRGFTLIELLVVIAIIGTLSSIVLSSLNTARNKGVDAAIRSNLDNARAQAALFYDANGNSYGKGIAGISDDACSSTANANGVKGTHPFVLAAARLVGIDTVSERMGGDATTAVCNAFGNGWAAQVPLKTSGFYCVDSAGTATTTPVTLLIPQASGDYTC